MEIIKNKEGQKLTLALTGRLDTMTSPSLEAVIHSDLEDVTELVYDFSKLDYISSAGLRLLLVSHKTMAKKGSMVIKGVSDELMEIFTVTGFSDILTIEK